METNKTDLRNLRRALEEARHALVITNGAVATDRPELFNFEEHPSAHWIIDNSDAIAIIDRALADQSDPRHGGA